MTAAKVGDVAISELLKGCTPGRVQTVGYMSIVPLLSDIQDERFAAPTGARVSTEGYGKLVVKNPEDVVMILPSGATYIVSQAAQNHAIAHAGVIKAKAVQQFHTAMCVQQTQGGYIAEGQHELSLLPVALREKAHKGRRDNQFNRLWPEIAKFNAGAGLAGAGGHLEKFFEKFTAELDQFVAEFEPLPKQVGAIVLINGKVVGVERCPSEKYFRAVWRPLIRECYGSMALLEAKKGAAAVPKTRVAVRAATDLADLEAALAEAELAERQKVAGLVNSIAELRLARTVDESKEFLVEGLGGERESFVGQSIRDGSQVVYASLVASEKWVQKEDWLFAAPFAM